MPLTTPEKVTPQINRLCDEIAKGSTPVYVPVQPAPGAQINDCFDVARLYAQQHGGHVQYGWMIFEFTEVLLEASFHAVWCSPSGDFVDVTPKQDGEQQILFLPDSMKQYTGQNYRPYLRAISHETIVEDFISLSERAFRIEIEKTINTEPGNDAQLSLTRELYEEYQAILARKADVIPRLEDLSKKLQTKKPEAASQPLQSKNSPCNCGSGKKYKKCHGAGA